MATRERAYALDELQNPERLDKVLIRIEPEAADAVGFLAARRQDEYGCPIAARANPLQHLIPVHPREHQVEDDDVGAPLLHCLRTHDAVFRHADVVTLELEIVRNPRREIGAVLHHEYARHSLRGAVRPRRRGHVDPRTPPR